MSTGDPFCPFCYGLFGPCEFCTDPDKITRSSAVSLDERDKPDEKPDPKDPKKPVPRFG